jgi:hypothetical protein
MTLTEMISLVRQDLQDEDSTHYRWTDLVLTRHIKRAVKEFSEAIPLSSKAIIATVSGSREVSLASVTGRVMVEAVEYPAGRYPAIYNRFSLWGETLTLLGENIPDGSDCYVYYGKEHSLTAVASTLPAIYEDLIAGGASGYAASEWAMYTLNRVNNGGPNTPEIIAAAGQTRLLWFRAELKRLGRHNRVQVNQLYQPGYPGQSRATDWGPG